MLVVAPLRNRRKLMRIVGQIAASLASLSRTVDDYSALSKKELIPEKQEKAFERVKNFQMILNHLFSFISIIIEGKY